MTPNDQLLEQSLDMLMGNVVALKAFMVNVSVTLSRTQPDLEQWARQFIANLHASVDTNETTHGPEATNAPLHEIARSAIDDVGNSILGMLARSRD